MVIESDGFAFASMSGAETGGSLARRRKAQRDSRNRRARRVPAENQDGQASAGRVPSATKRPSFQVCLPRRWCLQRRQHRARTWSQAAIVSGSSASNSSLGASAVKPGADQSRCTRTHCARFARSAIVAPVARSPEVFRNRPRGPVPCFSNVGARKCKHMCSKFKSRAWSKLDATTTCFGRAAPTSGPPASTVARRNPRQPRTYFSRCLDAIEMRGRLPWLTRKRHDKKRRLPRRVAVNRSARPVAALAR